MTPGAGHFWHQEHNLKKLGRGILGDSTVFFMFSYLAYVNHVTPGVGYFWHQGHNLKKIGRGPCAIELMITALSLVVSDNNICSCFPKISLC